MVSGAVFFNGISVSVNMCLCTCMCFFCFFFDPFPFVFILLCFVFILCLFYHCLDLHNKKEIKRVSKELGRIWVEMRGS